MATTAQIQITVDEAGVVTGVNKIGQSVSALDLKMQEMGARADKIWGNLANAPRDVQQQFAFLNSEAAKLSSNTIAVSQEMVRLTATMNDAAGASATLAASHEAVSQAVGHTVPQYAAASAAVRLLEGNQTGSIRAAERFLSTTLQLGPALQAAFPVIGAIAMIGVLEHLGKKFNDLIDYAAGFDATLKKMEEGVAKTNWDSFLNPPSAAQGLARLKEVNAQIADITRQISALKQAQSALRGSSATPYGFGVDQQLPQIDELTKKLHDLEETERQLSQNSAEQSRKEAEQKNKDQEAADKQAQRDREQQAKQEEEIQKQIRDDTIKLRDQASQAGLKGIDLVIAKEKEEADLLQARFGKLTPGLQGSLDDKLGAEIDAEMAKEQQKKQAALDKSFEQETKAYEKHESDIAKLQDEATNAGLKGADLIIAKEQEKIDKLNVLDVDYEQRKVLIEQQANAEIEAEQQRTMQRQQEQQQRYTQQLSDDFYQMFNEITDGHVGKLIKDGFTRLFSNILAQWVATVGGIGAVSTRGGVSGMFASVLGKLFGLGGSGGGAPTGAGSGPYGLPPGVAMNFDGSDITPEEAAQLGSLQSSPLGIGGNIIGGILGAGSLSTAAASPSSYPGTPPFVQSQSSVSGASAATGALKGIFNRNLNIGSLKLPGSLIGAGGLMLGLAALESNNKAFNILGTAASGAMLGFGFGGPIGAGIGAAVGALVGFFKSLFGGGPSKHTLADRYIQANILPAIQQELTNYEGFQTDYATAIGDLDKMKTQSLDTLHQQFGKDAATDEWNKYIVPAITQAETTIKNDEAERNRRSSLAFGPPQFATGGLFLSGNGTGIAQLHDYEVIMGQKATRTYGADNLLAMNAAAERGTPMRGVGGSEIHVHVHTLDTKTMATWLRTGGAEMISSAVQRNRLEGR